MSSILEKCDAIINLLTLSTTLWRGRYHFLLKYAKKQHYFLRVTLD